MRIVHITPYYPPSAGGMQTVVSTIAKEFSIKKHSVEVLTTTIGGGKKGISKEEGVKVKRISGFSLFHTPIALGLVPALFKVPKDSVAHIHAAHAIFPEISLAILKLRKIPCIVHAHSNLNPVSSIGKILSVYRKVFWKMMLRKADKVIFPTEDYMNIMRKEYGLSKQKTVVVPNGIYTKQFALNNNKNKNKTLSKNKTINLLFVGRLSNQKNIPLLIESVEILKEKYKIKLNIIGKGEKEEEIIKIILEKGLQNEVKLLGEKKGMALIKSYSGANIFVIASNFETFGIVIIEAMASNLPVVSTNIVGVKNIISNEKTGLLVAANPYEFSKGIEKFIKDTPFRNKITNQAHKKSQEFDWKSIVAKFENIYADINEKQN